MVRVSLTGMDHFSRDVQLVRAEEEHFLEGIVILAQLELMEKLVEEALEEVLVEILTSGGNLETVLNGLANRGLS